MYTISSALCVCVHREVVDMSDTFHMNHLSLCCSIQADITDINDIFKDLGMMVHEQGDMIGEILSPARQLLVCSSNNATNTVM